MLFMQVSEDMVQQIQKYMEYCFWENKKKDEGLIKFDSLRFLILVRFVI